ncbi:hypothetical protein [Desulfohalovibrio reitneri]|uniref:hypothetical protein n=1 Tax=Desulfohalovibrio reitneri TaxID=1307759 RepID=UPI0004A756C1|nr:hypothetical protein [Desulfohalovibrio reitneri]
MSGMDVICPHCDKSQKVVEDKDPGHMRATCQHCSHDFLYKVVGEGARAYKPEEAEQNKK